MRTITTSLAVLAFAVLAVVAPSAANAAPKATTAVQYGYHWGP